MVLFDQGSTHSFSSFLFAKQLAKSPEPLDFDLSMATPLRESVITDIAIKGCLISVEGREFVADLIILDMRDFDVILGMD